MGTPSQLSHPIQEVCHCLIILCFGLKASPVNLTGELATLGGCLARFPALGEDLDFVGVVCHVTIIGTGSGDSRGMVDSLPTGRAADQFVSFSVRK